MSVRDTILPSINVGRSVIAGLGLRRFTVTLRRRIWSGQNPGQGNATNQDIVIAPLPRVRDLFAAGNLSPQELEYIAANSNVVRGRLYKVDRITPQFLDANGNVLGGYTAQQLRMWPAPDARHIEQVVVLVGDDGWASECVQMTFEQDRSFGYTMIVKEQDRPKVPLQSIALTPATPALAVGAKQQMLATGTFTGGTPAVVTGLCLWASSNLAVATVDTLGVVSAVGAGTATITAVMTGTKSTAVVTAS